MSPTFDYVIFREAGGVLHHAYSFKGPALHIVKQSLPLIKNSGWFDTHGRTAVIIQAPELMSFKINYISTDDFFGTFNIRCILNSLFLTLDEPEEYFDVNQVQFIQN